MDIWGLVATGNWSGSNIFAKCIKFPIVSITDNQIVVTGNATGIPALTVVALFGQNILDATNEADPSIGNGWSAIFQSASAYVGGVTTITTNKHTLLSGYVPSDPMYIYYYPTSSWTYGVPVSGDAIDLGINQTDFYTLTLDIAAAYDGVTLCMSRSTPALFCIANGVNITTGTSLILDSWKGTLGKLLGTMTVNGTVVLNSEVGLSLGLSVNNTLLTVASSGTINMQRFCQGGGPTLYIGEGRNCSMSLGGTINALDQAMIIVDGPHNPDCCGGVGTLTINNGGVLNLSGNQNNLGLATLALHGNFTNNGELSLSQGSGQVLSYSSGTLAGTGQVSFDGGTTWVSESLVGLSGSRYQRVTNAANFGAAVDLSAFSISDSSIAVFGRTGIACAAIFDKPNGIIFCNFLSEADSALVTVDLGATHDPATGASLLSGDRYRVFNFGATPATDAAGNAVARATQLPAEIGGNSNVATPTNITAGTITNLNNAPTNGDFTSAMKTSLNNATPSVSLPEIDGQTFQEAMQIICAVLAGKCSGMGSGTETFFGLDGTTKRATISVDPSGTRTATLYF